MADCRQLFRSKESQNWLQCSLAVHIVRKGLLRFCQDQAEKFHKAITTKLSITEACTKCSMQDVIPYSQPGHSCRHGHCRCPSVPCALNFCDRMKKEIEREHRQKHISWKNTNMAKWLLCSWEVAKCYFLLEGYKEKEVSETDFNDLICLMKTNRHFERLTSLVKCHNIWDTVRINWLIY